MGLSRCRWVVHWTIYGSLSLHAVLHYQHMQRARYRHPRIFSAQHHISWAKQRAIFATSCNGHFNCPAATEGPPIPTSKNLKPLGEPPRVVDPLPRVTPSPSAPPFTLPPPVLPSAAAAHVTSPVINHIYDDNGKKRSQDKLLNDDHSERWTQALSNELGRLTQGNAAGVSSNDAMDFIFSHEVPQSSKVTYANFVCDYRPLKDEPWRVRLVVGGDKLE